MNKLWILGAVLPLLAITVSGQSAQQETKTIQEMKSAVSASSMAKGSPMIQPAFMQTEKTKVNPACRGTAKSNPCSKMKMRRQKAQSGLKAQDLTVSPSELVSTSTPIDRSDLDSIAAKPFAISPGNMDISLIRVHGVETAAKNKTVGPIKLSAADSADSPSITNYIQFGNPGTAVTFNGMGFGSPQSNSVVTVFSVETFTNTTWPVQTWTDTQIVATIPSTMPLGKVYLTIYVGGVGIPGTFAFTVGTPPVFASYSPVSGAPGTLIKIVGSGFGQLASSSYVAALSSVTNQTSSWTPTLWTDTEIDVRVPVGFPQGMVWLYVGVAGLASIGTNPFTVGVPPVIDCYAPAFGPPGTLVTINGSGFGSSQGNSSVPVFSRLTNTWSPWPVTTWGDTQITLSVPANTPSGLYYFSATVDGLQSIGTNPFQVGFPPVISDYSPLYGNPGTQIMLIGSGFGQTQGTNTVQAISSVTNTTSSWPVISWSDTQIVVTVPNTTLGNVYLYVQVGPLASIGTYPFLVGIPPFITSYSPTTGPAATMITLNGSGFGTTQGSGSVLLQSVTNIHTALTVVSWSDTQVTVSVPKLTPICLSYLSITVDGLSSIGTLPFQVTSQ